VPDYRYLVVGGGMTADAACKGIRSIDPDGSIGLVGDEPDPPYARPPLTKGLWLGKEESSIWRGTADEGVDLRLGRTVVGLDLGERTATDDRGDTYGYERLLLATGGRPRQMPGAADGVISFRTLADYRAVRAAATEGARVVVVGGGFIGSEIAAALATNGCAVTMVFPEKAIGARLFPQDLALSVTNAYRDRGVEVATGARVASVERVGPDFRVTTEAGTSEERFAPTATYRREIEAFANEVRGARGTLASGEDGVRVIELASAAIESIQSRRSVKL